MGSTMVRVRKTFYGYFKENMDAMGAPCPETLFSTATTATATIKTILAEIEKHGPSVTVAELAVAGTGLEILGFAAAGTAAAYVGICIGSLAVATGKSISGGYSLGDLFATAHLHDINSEYLAYILQHHNFQRKYSTICAV